MSSKTTSPAGPVDEPSVVGRAAEAGTDPDPIGDELPFESPEFGVGGFFPRLDSPPVADPGTDPGTDASPPLPDLPSDLVAARRGD